MASRSISFIVLIGLCSYNFGTRCYWLTVRVLACCCYCANFCFDYFYLFCSSIFLDLSQSCGWNSCSIRPLSVRSCASISFNFFCKFSYFCNSNFYAKDLSYGSKLLCVTCFRVLLPRIFKLKLSALILSRSMDTYFYFGMVWLKCSWSEPGRLWYFEFVLWVLDSLPLFLFLTWWAWLVPPPLLCFRFCTSVSNYFTKLPNVFWIWNRSSWISVSYCWWSIWWYCHGSVTKSWPGRPPFSKMLLRDSLVSDWNGARLPTCLSKVFVYGEPGWCSTFSAIGIWFLAALLMKFLKSNSWLLFAILCSIKYGEFLSVLLIGDRDLLCTSSRLLFLL